MELIDKMAKMQKEFKGIYNQFIGVYGVAEYGVAEYGTQVSKGLFLQNFKDFKVTKGGPEYPIGIEKNYNGALFFAFMDIEGLEDLKDKNLKAYEKIKKEWGELNE